MPSSPSRIFALCLLTLLGVSTVAIAWMYWQIYGYTNLFGDFPTFQAAAMHAATHALDKIYDIPTIRHLFAAHAITNFNFYLNPPTGLFIVYPLAFMAAVPALILWSIAQLALLFAAALTPYMRQVFAPQTGQAIPTHLLLGVCLLAFALQNILFGQISNFCAALFLLVLAWRRTHPIWAGIALGLFSFKPQLGVLLPVLLLAERNWKVLLWAAITALFIILLSVAFWGTGLWHDFGDMMSIRSQFMATDPALLFTISTSFYAAVRNLGANAAVGIISQLALAVLLLIALWPVMKRDNERHKMVLLILATYLITPYSLIYDMALLAVPCAALIRRAEIDRCTFTELVALMLLVMTPVATLLLQINHIPYSVIAIGFALIVAKRFSGRAQNA